MKRILPHFLIGVSSVLILSFFVSLIIQPSYRSQLEQSVVYVLNANGTGGGTGFHVMNDNGKKYLVTNAHVCMGVKEGDTLNVLTSRGVQVQRRIIEISKDEDLCIAEPVQGSHALTMAENPKPGQTISIFGHPRLQPNTQTYGEVTHYGDVKILEFFISEERPASQCVGAGRKIELVNMFIFQVEACVVTRFSFSTTAHGMGGNSGSPILDESNRVVGVLFAGDNQIFWGIGVPVNALRQFVNKY